MLKFLAIVLALAAAGDSLADAVQAPVPGAAVGMVFLVGVFALRGGPDAGAARLFDGMAPHLPLFFVPAAVGVITSAELLSQAWFHIAVAVALGTAATIAVTGLVAQALLRAPQEINTMEESR
jgi:holin-like protein